MGIGLNFAVKVLLFFFVLSLLINLVINVSNVYHLLFYRPSPGIANVQ